MGSEVQPPLAELRFAEAEREIRAVFNRDRPARAPEVERTEQALSARFALDHQQPLSRLDDPS